MTMDGDTTAPQMKPQDTTNFLLGGMNAKLDAVLTNQAGYDERLRTVEEIVAAIPKRTPWFSVVAGVAAIGAIVLSTITLLGVIYP